MTTKILSYVLVKYKSPTGGMIVRIFKIYLAKGFLFRSPSKGTFWDFPKHTLEALTWITHNYISLRKSGPKPETQWTLINRFDCLSPLHHCLFVLPNFYFYTQMPTNHRNCKSRVAEAIMNYNQHSVGSRSVQLLLGRPQFLQSCLQLLPGALSNAERLLNNPVCLDAVSTTYTLHAYTQAEMFLLHEVAVSHGATLMNNQVPLMPSPGTTSSRITRRPLPSDTYMHIVLETPCVLGVFNVPQLPSFLYHYLLSHRTSMFLYILTYLST